MLAANVAPAVGLLFWDWNSGDLLLLGWGEAAVIGIYALLKVAYEIPVHLHEHGH